MRDVMRHRRNGDATAATC